jgi:uncharacterized damage-inducible protein DinB
MPQMFTREGLLELYRHMEWADATLWGSVVASNTDDARLKGLFVHVHVVQRSFLHVWSARPVTDAFRQPDDFAALADVRDWARSYYPAAREVLESATDDRFDRVVSLPWSEMLAVHLGRPPGPSTFAETAFQVTSHTTYHRGQINMRLRELGGEPPLVDYIAWLWFGRPPATW